VAAEDLAGDPELERGDPVGDDDGDRMSTTLRIHGTA
jgi:hypothetical protein